MLDVAKELHAPGKDPIPRIWAKLRSFLGTGPNAPTYDEHRFPHITYNHKRPPPKAGAG